LCHCGWCKKTPGYNGNTFAVLMDHACSNFKHLSGTSDTFKRIADSANTMTSYACGRCSCIMWVHPESQPALRVIRTGTINDADVLNSLAPSKELYCSPRP
ncbi:hypothetical protein M436DRAFT_18392, partial [Aureobasidium namibiae CBS 147.97]